MMWVTLKHVFKLKKCSLIFKEGKGILEMAYNIM